MGSLIRIAIIFSLFFSIYAEILELTDSNRNQILASSDYSLIYFSRPGCKWCDRFNSTYEDLDKYYDTTDEFQLLKADGSVNKKLKIMFEVQSYPTVLLYSSKTKQVRLFTEARNLINLVNFINDNTDVINREIESNVHRVTDIKKLNLKNDLVVLAPTFSPIWEEYEYPSHFLQQTSYNHPYKFHVLQPDVVDSTDFMRKYQISSSPSVVYFKTPEQFKVFKTFSGNHLSGDKLNEDAFKDFVDNIHSEDTDKGTWFTSIQELYDHVNNLEYKFVDTYQRGFNLKQHQSTGEVDDESDYLDMVEHLEL